MSSKGLVLISGVNGYIAAQIAVSFLRAGWAVRGTVRAALSAQPLLETLKRDGLDQNVEIVEVPDISAQGAFDSAVKGVTVIAHVASHVSFAQTDPVPAIALAVRGTQSILESALRAGPQLGTVILASSLLTVWEPNKPGYVFTEADWNEWAPAQTERLGKDTPGNVTYMAGKVAAERAFWDFQTKMGDTKETSTRAAAFSMTAINPALVYGPPVFLPADPAKLSISTKPIWQIYSGGEVPPPTGGSGMSVDVRDVARLFVYAAEHPAETNRQRYLAVGGIAVPQALADILNDAFPERGLKKGSPGAGYDAGLKPSAVDIDALKAVRMTGESWIGMRTSVVDTAKALQQYL